MKAVLLTAMAVVSIGQSKPAPDTATFNSVKRIVGGVWRGKVGDLPVEQRFTLADGGAVVEGHGTVGDPKKPVLRMHSRIGIDSATGKVFYLDMHNADTVYFGHVHTEGADMVFDFTALSGDTGHWIAKERLTSDDHFESSLLVIDKDGNQKPVHGLMLDRKR